MVFPSLPPTKNNYSNKRKFSRSSSQLDLQRDKYERPQAPSGEHIHTQKHVSQKGLKAKEALTRCLRDTLNFFDRGGERKGEAYSELQLTQRSMGGSGFVSLWSSPHSPYL